MTEDTSLTDRLKASMLAPVSVAGGKYTFQTAEDGCSIDVLRYGEPWWTFSKGRTAIHALLYELQEHREAKPQGALTDEVKASVLAVIQAAQVLSRAMEDLSTATQETTGGVIAKANNLTLLNPDGSND